MSFVLRDYQIEGIDFLKTRKRAMLTDAPGLGKTPQAAYAAESPTLVVCPNPIVPQWADWLISSMGESPEDVAIADGSKFHRYKVLKQNHKWTIINIEALSTLPDGFKELSKQKRWRTIIFDESHHLKSHNGIRAKTAVEMAKSAEYVFLLTATPVKREIDDFYMQLRILQPDLFKSYWRFVNTFCVTEDSYFGTKVLGAKQSMLPEFQQLLDIVRIGRNYEQTGRELPPVIEKYVPIILPPEIRKMYDEIIDYWRVRDESGEMNFTSYMEAMHSIRQHLTGSLKMDAVVEIADETTAKQVAFSWYKNTAQAVAMRLNWNLVTGDIDVSDRRILALGTENVSATISSINEGIDLSAARSIISVEEDWTPGSNYQATSRVIRERQKESNEEPVILTYVHCKDTIDEIIHNRSKARAGTVRELIKEALYL